MLIRIKKASDVSPSEITSKEAILGRRAFMTAAAASGAALLPTFAGPAFAAQRLEDVKKTSWGEAEKPTTLDGITSHNNFYEFGTGKSDPKRNAHTLKPKPWKVEIAGHAERPARSIWTI
jgi:sulfoxide reductase catalytic subunit YedY